MDIFLQTRDKTGIWRVFCHEPRFNLGPFPSEAMAEEIREALLYAYRHGRHEIQEGLRELIGAAADVGH